MRGINAIGSPNVELAKKLSDIELKELCYLIVNSGLNGNNYKTMIVLADDEAKLRNYPDWTDYYLANK